MNGRAWLIIAVEFLVAVVVVLILSSQLTKQKTRATAAETLAKQQQETITDMQTRQRDVAALDAKYTKELADANSENDRLRSKLAYGGRVRVAGKCEAIATTSGSVGNAGTIELSSGAGSNVLDIRAGIISDQTKIKYLQDYIRRITDERNEK